MKQYEQFSEEDFINDPGFQEWVFRPDEASELRWAAFLETCPQKKDSVARARALLSSFSFRQDYPTDEKVESSLTQVMTKLSARPQKGKLIVMNPVYRWLSVAAVLLLVVGSGYLLISGRQNSSAPDAPTGRGTAKTKILPGGDKAVLTLADGRQILLDSTGNGALSNQGGTMVIKLDGQLSYQDEQRSATGAVAYNTVTTPRGGQYQLILSDGSKVWLNAASSLRFPTAFPGTERTVELTGEGYFEVAHNAAKPFTVVVNEMQVKVLGTRFNINSYHDEPSAKTTLVEGRVLVKKGPKIIILNPGQQAEASGSETLRLQNSVDVEEAVAWKNGRFQFSSSTIQTIMRQAARWYDVDVKYEGGINETFSGALQRSENILQLLKIMEATGKVKFEINGKQVTVKAKK